MVVDDLDDDQARSLDAIHLATAQQLGDDLGVVVTYDVRMADAAAKPGSTPKPRPEQEAVDAWTDWTNRQR